VAHPVSYPRGIGDTLGVKRLGREAEHSPPSSAKVKNAWRYIFISPYVFIACYLVKHRNCLNNSSVSISVFLSIEKADDLNALSPVSVRISPALRSGDDSALYVIFKLHSDSHTIDTVLKF
jgi:hypothetical protein